MQIVNQTKLLSMHQFTPFFLLSLILISSTSARHIHQYGDENTEGSTAKQTGELKNFALNQVVPNQFSFRGFNGTWISRNEFYYRDSDRNFNKFNVETLQHTLLVAGTVFDRWGNPTLRLSPSGTKILIRYDVRTIFRHSTTAKYAIYDMDQPTQTVDIADGKNMHICLWTPDDSLVYVLDNDVYYRRNSGTTEIRLTNDGIPGKIYNGVPDWVYEEEVFGGDGAVWFSPDGSKMAMASFNDMEVEDFTYFLYGEPGNIANQYPQDVTIKYPKAGRTNPNVQLRVIDLSTVTLTGPHDFRNVPAPASVTADHILGTVFWMDNNRVGVYWLNRRQNYASIQSCNFATSQCEQLMEIDEPQGWIDVDTPRCTVDGVKCFFRANSQGWRRITSLDTVSKAVAYESRVGVTALSFNGYDEASQTLYYTSTTEENVQHRHVYAKTATTENCLTCSLRFDPSSSTCTYASMSFSNDFSNVIASCNGPYIPYVRIHKTATLEPVMSWEENLNRRLQLAEYNKPQIVYLRVPMNGFSALVKLHLPPEIEWPPSTTSATDKYPMIVQVYAGPNSVRGVDNYAIGLPEYYTTTRKVIHCQIDGRGSGNKGTDMMFAINNRMGTVEIEDQIAVTEYLQKTYSFIDAERTGIWGWSYGGYAAAMVLATDEKRVFQCGVSVAPVTSWIYYDSIYTERFMGLPTETDNLGGYNRTDVTRLVDNIKIHDFLLIHGNADDNVHYQQAMVLARALQEKSIMFEQMSYPDEAHGLSGVLPHLYHTIDQFWIDCLNLEVDD